MCWCENKGRVELQQVSSKTTISSIAHSSRCVKEIYLEESSFINFPGDTRSPSVFQTSSRRLQSERCLFLVSIINVVTAHVLKLLLAVC